MPDMRRLLEYIWGEVMNKEEAIKQLTKLNTELFVCRQGANGESLHMAIEALRAQLERENPKPLDYRYGRTYTCPPDCGGAAGDEYGYIPFCPKCGKELDEDHRTAYCEDCGYKLDWSTHKPEVEE